MAISKNYTSLIGYLGNDPELRQTKTSGTDVTSFSLAMNEEFEDRRGKLVERVTWIKIRVWDRKALPVVDYLRKGSLVEVEGKIVDPEWWEDDDGEIRVNAVVEARNVRFLDRVPADYEEDVEDEDERPRRRSQNTNRRSSSTSRRQSSTRSGSSRRERETEDEGKSNRVERLRELNRSSRRRRNEEDEEVEELSARNERSERKDRQAKRVPFSRNKV